SSYQLLLGPAVRAGYMRLSAAASSSAVEGLDLSGLWLGPCAQAAFQLTLTRRFQLRVGAELGYVARPLRGLDAERRPLLALAGPWIAGLVGVSWQLSP
ncbi:MAG: hypothetical protein ABW321_18070, partial [Polyangiales bacterium]